MWSAGNALDDVLAQLLRGIDALTDCRLCLLDHACGHALHPIDDRARSLRRALPGRNLFRRALLRGTLLRRALPGGALLRGALLHRDLSAALLHGTLHRARLLGAALLLRCAALLRRGLLGAAALLRRGFLCRTALRAAPLLFRCHRCVSSAG